MDPRVFLVLPEHISNAHQIWNYALLISQMSNLNSLDTNTASLLANSNNNKSRHGQKAGHQQDCRLSSEAQLLESLVNDLYLNDLKQDYLKLNKQAIMTILKIKKRNKASLFNLILPPALSLNNVTLLSQNPSNTTATIKHNIITTPWLLATKESDAIDEVMGDSLAEYESMHDTESQSSSSSSSVEGQPDKLSNPIHVNNTNETNNSNSEDNLTSDNLPEFDYNEGCKR